MFDDSDFSFLVNLERLDDYQKSCYVELERNPVIVWLEENLGPILSPAIWPCSGNQWKCWMVFDPQRNFELAYCEVNFTTEVDDSIISLFILRWT